MKNDNTIHELIEKFDFSELNQEQKQLVLLEITMDEYVELRKTILSTTAYFDNEPILMAEDLVVPTIKDKSVLSKIVNYKLPIYKVAAILMIVFCIDKIIPEESTKETQFVETSDEIIPNSEAFLAYNMYSSKNSIKYDTGLSRVYY